MRKRGMAWLRKGIIEVELATLVILLSALHPVAGQDGGAGQAAAIVKNGITITAGPKYDTGAKGENSFLIHQAEGWLLVSRSPDGTSRWSVGPDFSTWTSDAPADLSDQGPEYDGEVALYTGEGINAIREYARTAHRVSADLFRVRTRSSRDAWKTVTVGTVDILAPGAVSLVSDEGRAADAVLLHHGGIIDELTGDLYVSGYGSFADDELGWDGYGDVPGRRKFSGMLFRSSDQGQTLSLQARIDSRWMLGRIDPTDSGSAAVGPVRAITQEGYSEGMLAQAKNGDMLWVMRSGARISGRTAGIAPISGTPIYLAISPSEDTDRNDWQLPRELIPGPGVEMPRPTASPEIVVLGNGIVVVGAGRPGWLIFCEDAPPYRVLATQELTTRGSYLTLQRIGYDRVAVFYHDDDSNAPSVTFQEFHVEKAAEAEKGVLDIFAVSPWVVPATGPRLVWHSERLKDLVIDGGGFDRLAVGESGTDAAPPIETDTTYTMTGTPVAGGSPISAQVTVRVYPDD